MPIEVDDLDAGDVGITNSEQLIHHARGAWDEAINLGEQHGYRNAQTTVIAPTGTMVMARRARK